MKTIHSRRETATPRGVQRDYRLLERGDFIQIEGDDARKQVIFALTVEGIGAGMAERPPITYVVLSDASSLVFDPWIPIERYRSFEILGWAAIPSPTTIRGDK